MELEPLLAEFCQMNSSFFLSSWQSNAFKNNHSSLEGREAHLGKLYRDIGKYLVARLFYI